MEFFSFEIRLILGAILILCLAKLLKILIIQRNEYINIKLTKSIKSNIGEKLPLYKSNDFFLMSNAGEDLCSDDIKFELFDYCGSVDRMYYSDGEKNESSN